MKVKEKNRPDLKKQDTKKPEVKKMPEVKNGFCPFVPNIGNALQIR